MTDSDTNPPMRALAPVTSSPPDETITIPPPQWCPHCGGILPPAPAAADRDALRDLIAAARLLAHATEQRLRGDETAAAHHARRLGATIVQAIGRLQAG